MRSVLFLTGLALAVLLSTEVFAQHRETPWNRTVTDPAAMQLDRSGLSVDRNYWRQNLFKRLWGDQVYLFTTWIPADGSRPRVYVPLSAALVGASQSAVGGLDLQWSNSIERRSAGHDGILKGVTLLGDAGTGALVVGTTYWLSRRRGNDRMARVASLSGEAMVNAAIHNSLLKRMTRRSRPIAGANGEFFLAGSTAENNNRSFPSGHAMGAFSIAAVVAAEFRERRWVAWVAYGTAGAIGLSRVGLGKHFLSDVVVGAILGDSLGRMVVARSDGLERLATWRRFSPIVDPENGGIGVGFSYSW